jgi:hypothetical protein
VSTRLLLEGPDITALLARVRAEHGDAARIVKADKVRLGGFAGFFAKVRYEVVVEVPAGTVAVAPPATPAAPALVAAPAPAGVSVAAPVVPAPAPASLEELAALADSADTAEVTEASVPAERELVAARAPGRALSTESDQFAAVLSRLTDGLGTGIDFDALPPAPIEPPARFRPMYATSMAPPAAPEPAAPLLPALPVGPFDGLRALGVPVHLAASVNGEDLHADLVRVFGTLPPAPALPRRPGDVLVVVGDAAAAVPVGRALAKKMHLDPTKLLLAAPSTAGTGVAAARRVTGPADAERRARMLHRADVAHVVVVDAPLDGESAGWARDIADSLGATQVWAVVDATRKVGDLADHLDRLGPLDALVVERADVTRDPATVLDLRVPVALLEGHRATPRVWADLVADRMEAREEPGTPVRRGRRA